MAGEHVILLVEDDIQLGQTLKDYFEYNDLSVMWAKDGNKAIELFNETPPALILLDVVVPHKSGLEIAAEIREMNTKVPIIFMTGTALDTIDHIKGYELNAVNYLEKPIVPQIVLAQIKSLLQPMSIKKYHVSNLTIKIDNRLLIIDNEEFNLREKEIKVLALLLDNLNRDVTRNELLCTVWCHNSPRLNNILDSTISNIKKVLKRFPGIKIITIYGIGYRLEGENCELRITNHE